MLKILILAIILFSLTGCCDKVYSPRIEVLKKVEPITVSDDTIVGSDINKVKLLRQSEEYYIEQINKYNEEFTKPIN